MKRIIKALLFLCLLCLAACASHHKHMLGVPNAIKNQTPTIQVQRNWSANAGVGSGKLYVKLTPAVDNHSIFSADVSGRIYARDVSTGKRLWKRNIKTSITAGIAAGGGLVLIGTGDAHIFALSQQTGAVVWTANVGNEVLATPTLTRHEAIIKTIDGNIVALSLKNGHQLWTYEHAAPTLILRGSSSPQVYGKYVVAGFADGNVGVYTLNKGAMVWQMQIAVPKGGTDIERMIDIDADPVVQNNVVYAATYQGNIAALGLKQGHIIWRHKLSSYTGIALGKNLYVTDAQGNIWAFSKSRGVVIWKQSLLKGHRLTAPVITANSIVVADALGDLYWLSAKTGKFEAYVRVNKYGIIANPVAANGQVFVQTNRGRLVSYEAKGF